MSSRTSSRPRTSSRTPPLKTTALFNQEGETLASIAAVKYALESAQVVTCTNVKLNCHVGTEKPLHWKIEQKVTF